MGFFSKLWKGVKKVVKKIGKGIKKVVGKVGKFVGKLGIVGQIGMFFLMPHVAGFMMKGLSAASSGLLNFANATSGLGGALAKGLGTVLKTAHSFAGTVGNVFGTITEGVGNFAKTALNKIPGITIDGAATNFFGNDSAWSRTMDTGSKILDPFKGQTNFGKDTTFADASKEVGIKESTLRELNPQFGGNIIPEGANISTDFSTQGFNKAYQSGLYIDPVKSTFPNLVDPVKTSGYLDPVKTTFPNLSTEAPSEIIGEGLGDSYSRGVAPPDFDLMADATTPKKTASSLLSSAKTSLGESFSSDPLGTIRSGIDIAQQGKDLVTDEDYYQPQRGQVQDFGNAPTIQTRQVAGVDTSWMQFGTPAYQSGYSNYNPFAYLQFMQSRTA